MRKKFQDKFDGLTFNIPQIVKEQLALLIDDIEDDAYGRGYSECEQMVLNDYS